MKQPVVDSTHPGLYDPSFAQERLVKSELIFRYKTRSLAVINLIKRYNQPGNVPHVLDLGCSDGKTLYEFYLNLKEAQYWGIEFVEELILASPPLPENIKIIRGDVNHLPIQSQSMDFVVALGSLGYFNDPLAALKEAYRVLRVGGTLILTWNQPLWDTIAQKVGLFEAPAHLNMSKSKLFELVTQGGFVTQDYFNFMWAPVSFLPYLKVRISPRFALFLDKLVYRLKVFNFLFVNQCVVATKRR
ncbi:class I SAM-dependent methyltransferase [Deltaproteobacteria bacterium TL4]